MEKYRVNDTPDGGKESNVPIKIAGAGNIWTKTIYQYVLPLRMPGVSLEDCEEHNFLSARVTKKMELRAKNTSNTDCRLIAISSKLASDKNVYLRCADPNFTAILTIEELISGGDSGALQVYVEPVVPEPAAVKDEEIPVP